MTIDIFTFLDNLAQERYRAAIIHTRPDNSPALSQFSQKFCQIRKGKHLDLLNHFIQSPNLSETIDCFGPAKFREFLKEQSQSCSLLVIDRADFLLDTWRTTERQDFYRFVQNQWDGYKEGMKACLVFCLQTSLEMEPLKIFDTQGQSRIHQLSDFHDIA